LRPLIELRGEVDGDPDCGDIVEGELIGDPNVGDPTGDVSGELESFHLNRFFLSDFSLLIACVVLIGFASFFLSSSFLSFVSNGFMIVVSEGVAEGSGLPTGDIVVDNAELPPLLGTGNHEVR